MRSVSQYTDDTPQSHFSGDSAVFCFIALPGGWRFDNNAIAKVIGIL